MRTLQILNKNKYDGKFVHYTKHEIHKIINDYGYSISFENFDNIIDSLEKSLFVRSSVKHNLKYNNGESEEDKDKEVKYKCSNYGDILLNSVLCEYSYITAVCQNTCLPTLVAEKIEYKQKKLSEEGAIYYIDKNWIISIIPYLVLFLRVIKSVEISNSKDKELYVHIKIIKNCSDAISAILYSRRNRLSNSELQTISDECMKALE